MLPTTPKAPGTWDIMGPAIKQLLHPGEVLRYGEHSPMRTDFFDAKPTDDLMTQIVKAKARRNMLTPGTGMHNAASAEIARLEAQDKAESDARVAQAVAARRSAPVATPPPPAMTREVRPPLDADRMPAPAPMTSGVPTGNIDSLTPKGRAEMLRIIQQRLEDVKKRRRIMEEISDMMKRKAESGYTPAGTIDRADI